MVTHTQLESNHETSYTMHSSDKKFKVINCIKHMCFPLDKRIQNYQNYQIPN